MCRICLSPHLLDYSRMKERGHTAMDIWKESRRRGEVIPYQSFSRHFRVCWKTKKEWLFRESTEFAKESVARKFVEQQKILDELGNSLKILKDMIEAKKEEIKEGTIDYRNIISALAEIRLSLKLLWDLSERIEVKPQTNVEELKEKLMLALRDIPYKFSCKIEQALSELD